ncbi:MAG: hemolysin family protein [Lachnospiraceae bacterium]|nr:hemolysin family protein [Lachnospiraceae bacterium]
MDPSDAIQVLILIILVACSAFFSSSETAMTTVSRIRVRNLVEEGDRRAEILSSLIEEPGKMLSAILIGNNIVNISASALATTLATKWLGGVGPGISTGALTLIILVFAEVTPKTKATIQAEKIALKNARPIYVWTVIATPLIFIINKLSIALMFLMGVNPNEKTDSYTEQEIRTIVDVSHEEGVTSHEEREMINNVFDFGDSTAKDVIVPKVDMDFVQVDATYQEVIDLYRQKKYTRYPVYADNTDTVIGMINVKDLLIYEDKEHFSVRNILRSVLYTHELKKTSDLMLQMRKSSINLAIVLDEYGVTCGMVTIEDLLEEIVGDIRDEYDDDEDELIRKLSDHEYIVDGAMSLDDLNEKLGLEEKDLLLESEGYDSVGGVLIELLDHLPAAGEEASTEGGVRLLAETVEHNRIAQVHIWLPDSEETTEQQEDS